MAGMCLVDKYGIFTEVLKIVGGEAIVCDLVASNEVGRLIHFYDVASNPRGFGNAGMAGDVGAWQQQVLPFFMDSTAQDLRILLNVDETTLTADCTVWWDDVELSLTDPNITTPTPTPPPSAIRNWTLD